MLTLQREDWCPLMNSRLALLRPVGAQRDPGVCFVFICFKDYFVLDAAVFESGKPAWKIVDILLECEGG